MTSTQEEPSSVRRPKKQRKSIDLNTKMMVIKDHREGKKVNMIAQSLNLSTSTVSTILKDRDRICKAVIGSARLDSTVITKHRIGPINKMEKMLYLWIKEQIENHIPLSLSAVQTKAISLFESLKEGAGEGYNRKFLASNGWYERFKKRFHLQKVRITGERPIMNDEITDEFFYDADNVSSPDQGSEKTVSGEPDEFEQAMLVKDEENEAEEEEKVVKRKLTTEGLSEGLSLLNKALAHFEALDPNVERFKRIQRMTNDVFYPYSEIYERKKKKATQSNLIEINPSLETK